MRTTWQEFIQQARNEAGDTSDVVAVAPEGIDLSQPFNAGYGGSEGKPFTLWTERRVYFPAVYDGAEWVESVPRNPCDEATAHIGSQ